MCCFATLLNPRWPVSLTWEAAASASYDLHARFFPVSNSCLALRFVSCRCVFCFPLFPPCTLSLCLQEEGVVSFCKVCAIGLVNTPSHHLLNDTIKARPLPPVLPRHPSHSYASHPTPPTPSSSMCHRAYGIWITHHASGQAAWTHHSWHSGDSGSTHPIPSLFLACFFFCHFSIMANLEVWFWFCLLPLFF